MGEDDSGTQVQVLLVGRRPAAALDHFLSTLGAMPLQCQCWWKALCCRCWFAAAVGLPQLLVAFTLSAVSTATILCVHGAAVEPVSPTMTTPQATLQFDALTLHSPMLARMREGLIKDESGRDVALNPRTEQELVDYEGMLVSGAVAQRRG